MRRQRRPTTCRETCGALVLQKGFRTGFMELRSSPGTGDRNACGEYSTTISALTRIFSILLEAEGPGVSG